VDVTTAWDEVATFPIAGQSDLGKTPVGSFGLPGGTGGAAIEALLGRSRPAALP